MGGVEELSCKDKIVVYSGTRNYYPYMLPAVTSLIYNNHIDRIYFLIEDDKFPYHLPDNVVVCNMINQPYFTYNGINYNSKWTYMTMLKMALPKMFPMHDTMLYLDVDTIVDNDISGLWDYSLDDYYFGAVKEIHRSTPSKPYFNAGVLLINNKKLNENNMCDLLITALNTNKYTFVEQDCMNEMCEGKILSLPSDYNVSPFNAMPDVPRIIHYAACQNWTNEKLYQRYNDLYWDTF